MTLADQRAADTSAAVARFNAAFGQHDVDGIDVFRVRDGRVAEKPSYVKG